jgi:phosphoglycerate dehydrogenase-like enzyme
MKPMLLILDDWEDRIKSSDCWSQIENRVDIKFLDKPIETASPDEIKQVEYLMALRERTTLDENVFQKMPNLKLILQTGGHAYHIDTVAAQKRNILIALGRRVKAPLISVPELTFAFMLGLAHKVYDGNRSMRNAEWKLLTGHTLSNKRLGILGLGRHGSRVAHIARTAFNMNVIAWDRMSNYDPGHDIKRLPLDELLKTSDVASIHLRLSKESTNLINKERLALMKRNASTHHVEQLLMRMH